MWGRRYAVAGIMNAMVHVCSQVAALLSVALILVLCELVCSAVVLMRKDQGYLIQILLDKLP